jgi:hypothetical protein
MLGTFPNAFSQVVTSQRYFPKSGLAASLDPLAHPSRTLASPSAPLKPVAPQKALSNLWKVTTWENVTWEVAVENMSLGKYLKPSNYFRFYTVITYFSFFTVRITETQFL